MDMDDAAKRKLLLQEIETLLGTFDVSTLDEQGKAETYIAIMSIPSPEQLEAAITPKTKAIILCSPSNPTGSVCSREACLISFVLGPSGTPVPTSSN